MKDRERIVVSGLVMLMLLTWLGFAFHRSPDFAGSFWGGVLGVSAAALMSVPLLYLFIKRIKPLKRFATKYVSMRTMLKWHIYAGIFGPILAILHTGHKFESPLGIALTGMTLVVVVSGFIGRYLMSFLSGELKEKRATLAALRKEYDRFAVRNAGAVTASVKARVQHPLRTRIASLLVPASNTEISTAINLATSIADLEYAIASNKKFKRAFGIWLKLHIVISFTLYGLLALHIWASIHFGLRWFS